jgi:hypothetical protein
MRLVEKSLRRSARRFERDNHIAQTLRLARLLGIGEGNSRLREEREEEARHWAMRLHQNRKKCSCWMCGNGRRLRKGNERFSFQELKLRLNSREQCANFERD